MKTSVSSRDLVIITKALRLYAGRTPEKRAENIREFEINELAEHIDIIRQAAAIDANPTVIEVKS